MARHNSATGKIIGAIVVIVIVAVAAWWYFTRMPGVDFTRHGPAPSAPAKASTAPPPIEHPIAEAETGPAPAATAPLPLLDASDSAAASALASLPGADGLAGLLLARGLIPHIVATVDALPRHDIGVSILPLRTPKGTFVVDTSSGQPVLDRKDYVRYAPYMKIVEAVPSRTLVTWYVHWYPLFQQAYRQLGYPHGYFNDRLIQAIDNMLAAPNAQPPVALVATQDGHYAFADPTWEALSVGQKLMIRIGPENERTIRVSGALTLPMARGPEVQELSPLPPGEGARRAGEGTLTHPGRSCVTLCRAIANPHPALRATTEIWAMDGSLPEGRRERIKNAASSDPAPRHPARSGVPR